MSADPMLPCAPLEPTPKPVLACDTWHTNGDLIADVARLGWLQADRLTFDPTYGLGNWWTQWQPDAHKFVYRSRLVEHDFDFRRTGYPDGEYEQIAYDPPYVATGGRTTTTMPEFQERYGIGEDCPATPIALQALINAGMDEMIRILAPRGILLVKCQDYVSSGRIWNGTHRTLTHALDFGLEMVDRFERMQKNPRPQPLNRHTGGPSRQVHARRNLSTLFVFRKGRR